MSKSTGGPAFPMADPFAFSPANEGYAKRLAEGMSMRDYFAGKAITGTNPGGAITDADVAKYAAWAYRMADAMLAERAK